MEVAGYCGDVGRGAFLVGVVGYSGLGVGVEGEMVGAGEDFFDYCASGVYMDLGMPEGGMGVEISSDEAVVKGGEVVQASGDGLFFSGVSRVFGVSWWDVGVCNVYGFGLVQM